MLSVVRASKPIQAASSFCKSEAGTVTIFGLLLLILMLASAGMGIDLMRVETQRVKMQYTLDRAVLAAGGANTTQEAHDIVQDYFSKAGLDNYNIDVEYTLVGGARTVAAQAHKEVPSLFLNMVGVDTLRVPAAAEATQSAGKMEISLVLDYSTSMEYIPADDGTNRLTVMQSAATDFVNSVLGGQGPNSDISISLVPYQGTVSAGSTFGPYLPFSNEHNYSYCADFLNADFTNPVLPTAGTFQRFVHFDKWGDANDPAQDFEVCNTNGDLFINPWSNSATDLTTQINGVRMPPDGQYTTEIQNGVFWGAMLLDPSFQNIANTMAYDGVIPFNRATDFPAQYNDSNVQKIMVILTDGVNIDGWRLRPSRSTGMSPVWRHVNSSGDDYYSVYMSAQNKYVWYDDPNGNGTLHDSPRGISATQMTWMDVWGQFNAEWIEDSLFEYVTGTEKDAVTGAIIKDTSQARSDQLDMEMIQACTAAKSNGITIFAIQLERNDTSSAFLQCASSDAHAFNTLAADLDSAFSQIANEIGKLRLTK